MHLNGMHPSGLLAGVLLLLLVLWETFETIVLPRRVSRRFRLTRLFYRSTWFPWHAVARRLPPGNTREAFLSVYGPASLLSLLALWASLLVVSFGLLHWGCGAGLHTPSGRGGLPVALYFSGTTFFTIGLGDVTPTSAFDHLLTVAEGGTGLGFIALVISYLPPLSQAFSRREVNVATLDARAGSPPSAAELLRRHAREDAEKELAPFLTVEDLAPLLTAWELWSADLLETHISFPVLAYFRSQHTNQSWLAALATVLDTSALIIAGLVRGPVLPARLTFAMARHAVVDLTIVFGRTPQPDAPDRLPPAALARLRDTLTAAGFSVAAAPERVEKLQRLRGLYEPYLFPLSEFLLMSLPPWVPPAATRDNWERMV